MYNIQSILTWPHDNTWFTAMVERKIMQCTISYIYHNDRLPSNYKKSSFLSLSISPSSQSKYEHID